MYYFSADRLRSAQVSDVTCSLRDMREKAESTFSKIFQETTTLAQLLHGEDFQLNARQVHRANVHAESVEEYFRMTLYNEFLLHIVAELESRFPNSHVYSTGLLQLLPEECRRREDSNVPQDLEQAASFYLHDLPHPLMLPLEYRMWIFKWKESSGDIPTKLTDVYSAVSFPNIHTSEACLNITNHFL